MNLKEKLKQELNWSIKKAKEAKEEEREWQKGFGFAYQLQAVKIFEMLLDEGEIEKVD